MFKKTTPYAVELNGQLTVCKDGVLETITALNAIKGDCRVVSDFENAIARRMTVEADPRYVELMISRQLQEAGEFDEPVTVIPHWKKKRGPNATDIFFTAIPSKRYFQYLELVSEHKNSIVVLPLQSVLMATLKKFGKQHPVAVVVQYDRYADLLIGTNQKIWFADRVVAFDQSEEQISALWETVRADIESAGSEYQQPIGKMIVVTWVDSGKLPQWSDEDAPEVICLNEQTMDQDGQEVKASLPVMIDKTPAMNAVASVQDKVFYGAGRALPILNCALILMALLLAVSGIWFQIQSNGAQALIQNSIQEADNIRAKAPKTIQSIPYEQALSFVEQLWSSRKLPTYGQILSDMGQGMDRSLVLDNIKANYSQDKVEIKAYGTTNAPFEIAYKAYQMLQARLLQRGYIITEDRFDTQIQASNFVLQFFKEVQ